MVKLKGMPPNLVVALIDKMRHRVGVRDKTKSRGSKISRIKKPLTRKERRKQERFAKKKRSVIFHSKKSNTSFTAQANGRTPHIHKNKRQSVDRVNLESSGKRASSKAVDVVAQGKDSPTKSSQVRQSAAMMREDREIARLEKLLKLKKRKKLPSSFKEEGLDCIQSICMFVGIVVDHIV